MEDIIINKINELAFVTLLLGSISIIFNVIILFIVTDIPEKIKKFGKNKNNDDIINTNTFVTLTEDK